MTCPCTSVQMSSPLLLLLLCVFLLGGAMMLLSLQVYRLMQRRMQRKHRLQEEIARLQRKQEQEAACLERKRQEALSDHLLDARIGCPECRQKRHPGMVFPFPGLRLCHDHRHLLQTTATTGLSQQPMIHLPSACDPLVVEEIFA